MFRYRWILLLFVSVGFPQPGWADYQDCLQLYQSKQLTRAAACFETVADSLPVTGLSAQQKARKGRALRNAANLLEQFATKSTNVEEAAYLRERATKLLQRYLHENLHEVEYQKKNAELLMLRMTREVGYATLTIVPGTNDAKLHLRGHRAEFKTVGTWSQTVRPGTYTLEIFYPSNNQHIRRSLVVPPGKNTVLTLTPPSILPLQRDVQSPTRLVTPPTIPSAPSRGNRVAAWVTIGVGTAVLLGGGAVLIAASLTDNQKLALHRQEFSKAPSDRLPQATTDITQLHQTSSTLFPAGWIALGVGATTTTVGGLLFLLPSSTPHTPR